MPVPDYQTMMRPVLRLAAEQQRSVRECAELVGDEFGLSEEERNELLPSGRQKILHNRAHWACFYMIKAGLLERPRRGYVVATDRGREVLRDFPERIDNSVLARFPEFQVFLQQSRRQTDGDADAGAVTPAVPSPEEEVGTPEDRIVSAVAELNSTLREELLERIVVGDPTFFEHLIIDLMVAMGYGGPGSGRHLGKTSDGGVDGIIRADPLGLTTSHFAPSARQYAERSPKRLILIDGEELARLMIRYGVGVRTFDTVQLKRIDIDYFPASEA